MGIKILIADDQKIVREGIQSLLNNEKDIEIVGEAEDGRAAVQLAHELNPDIIIMEVVMPNLNGVEATRQIVHELAHVKIIALSGYIDRRSVSEMLKAGASGYVSKQGSFRELVSAIQSVASNQTYLSTQISGIVVDGYLHNLSNPKESAFSVLTPREREVLQLIAEGKTTKGIARELYVSIKTIDWHRGQLMKKLHVESIAELVKYATNEGLTPAYF